MQISLRSAALASVLLLAFLSDRASTQGRNLLSTNLATWSIVANPKDVKLDVTPNRIAFRWILGGRKFFVFSASTTFTAPHSGTYSLWLDAEVNYGGSRDDAVWLIPGVASAKWRQRDYLGRDVAQWVVPLQKNQKYTLYILIPVRSYGTDAWIRPASLIPVDLPVVQPGGLWYNGGESYGEFGIVSERRFQAPQYVVVAWPHLLQQPVVLPFGELWLQQPLPVWFLSQPEWKPRNRSEAWDAFRLLAFGMHWQVLEFDGASPATSLRLGSPVFLQSSSRR